MGFACCFSPRASQILEGNHDHRAGAGIHWRQGVLNTPLPEPLSDVWIDRDLSWLDFNERVLAEALDERTPLLERAKFLAIFTSNLDEFFMKRMAVLRHGHSPAERAQFQQVRDKLIPMLQRQAECYRQQIIPQLGDHGIAVRNWNELTASQRDEAGNYFDTNLSPALTPLSNRPPPIRSLSYRTYRPR